MSTALFAIYAEDHPNSLEKRLPLRDAHLARLKHLQQAQRLALAGPLAEPNGGVIGSLIVAKFDDIEQAHAWFAQDPYVQAGIYQRVTIKPFTQVFPE
jgi:hypothetical protein